jgi:hypothetical protein
MFCPKCGAQNADDAQACAACGAEMLQPLQPAQPAPAPTMMGGAAPRTSPMAIWSLILGILGLFTCGMGAIVGLILGILGLKQVKERPAEFSGSGLATTGIVVSVIMILVGMLATPAAILFPVFSRAREAARQSSCQSNVRQLGMAVRMYLGDWQDTYPPAAQWSDALKSYTEKMSLGELVYRCPSVPAQQCGYGFNAALGVQPEGVVQSPAETVSLFESDNGWNASGGREAMITRPRHLRGFTTGYADGHTQMVSPGSESFLRWNP